MKTAPSSLPGTLSQRKALGAWYTPSSLVEPLTRWAIRRATDRVLDPATGDGAFLAAAAARLKCLRSPDPSGQLVGIDISISAVDASRQAVAGELGYAVGPTLIHRDFFAAEPPRSLVPSVRDVNAVIGNPPYVRYQLFAGQQRALAQSRCRELGVELSGLSSSWAPFVVHACQFLSPGGRLALVLPEEIRHAKYARPIRDFLRRSFRFVSLVSFEAHVFPDSQERVVLLLADGWRGSPAGELRLVRLPTPLIDHDLEAVLSAATPIPADTEVEKWDPRESDPALDLLRSLETDGHLVPLRSLGKAGIGFVSGANDFFVLRPSESRAYGFPPRALTPTVLSARHVRGVRLVPADIRHLRETDERCLLWNGNAADSDAGLHFIREGTARGIPKRYKCRMRSPWYKVPGVTRPDALMTYMCDEFPRLALNEADVACSNTLLAIQLDGLPKRLFARFVAAFYNSATILSAELVGRSYGGGVLKLEPSEADRLLVPSLAALNKVSLAQKYYARLDVLVRSRRYESALRLADEAVLRRSFGLSIAQVRLLAESRAARRLHRSNKGAASA